ncbi:MAG: acyl-CoA dehydrogenase family protein, partial [Proteobacteria bacterium]|nr:acyl-CoA dehydrogenase family protein [Pseudomonadota bacterium]
MPYFTDTQLAMREGIRRMVDKEIRPIAAEVDATDKIPERIFHLFGDMG